MPSKKPRARRAKPPSFPPTAVSTTPPGAPGAPTRRRIVCFTGGAQVGKSTIAAATARSWQAATGRPVRVLAAAGESGWAASEERAESADLFLEIPRSHRKFPEAVRRADVTFWILAGDPLEAGVALGWLKHARSIDGRAAVKLVVNQVRAEAAPGLDSLLRRNGEAPVASVPWDAKAPALESSDELLRSVAPLVGELRRSLGAGSDGRVGLGEILVHAGMLSEDQLRRALASVGETGLGETVARLGYAPEEAVAVAVSKQLGVPYASRENRVLKVERTQGLELIVSAAFAREHFLLPLFIDGKVLAVAMADPTDARALELLRSTSGLDPQPFIAAPGQLRSAIDDFYGIAPAAERDPRITTFLNAVFKQAIGERASTVLLDVAGGRPRLRFRIDSVLYERMPPPPKLYPAILDRIKLLANIDSAKKELPQEGVILMTLRDRDVEVLVFVTPTASGESVTLRFGGKGGEPRGS